ncbi:MAG TPA: hypothetical protein VGM59_04885 [Dongiaceae bacterium]
MKRSAAVLLVLGSLALNACGKDSVAERQKQANDLAKGIEDYLAAAETGSAAGLHHDKVTVTPVEGDDFAVTISGVKFGTSQTSRAEIGDISYRIKLKENGDYTADQLAYAHEIPVLGADGKPVGSVKLEPGNFQAEWSKALNTFIALDWQVKNFDARGVAADEGAVAAQAMEFKIDTTDKGNGIVDQKDSMSVDSLTVSDPGSQQKLSIAKMSGSGSMSGLDIRAFQAGMAKLRGIATKAAALPQGEVAQGQDAQDQTAQALNGQALNGQASNGAAPAPAGGLSDEDRKTASDLVHQLPKVLGSLDYNFTVEGVSASESSDTESFKLASAGFALGVKDLNSDKSELDFEIKHDGLTLGGTQDPVMKALLPHTGNLALSFVDIPTPALLDAMAQSLPNLLTGDQTSRQMGLFMLMGSMSELLQKSDIKVKINPSGLAAEQAKLTAQGDLKVATTPYMAIGTVTAMVTGLDDLINTLGAAPASQPDVMQAIAMLQSLKGYGQRSNGTDGKPVDQYKFDLTPDGQMLVNGKPINGL